MKNLFRYVSIKLPSLPRQLAAWHAGNAYLAVYDSDRLLLPQTLGEQKKVIAVGLIMDTEDATSVDMRKDSKMPYRASLDKKPVREEM